MALSSLYLDPDKILKSEDFEVVEDFLKKTYRTRIGWHYIIDLTWIYSIAKNWPSNYKILDAGGGRGPAQFLLAEMGFDVTNIDLFHMEPYDAQRRRYQLQKQKLNSFVSSDYVEHIEIFRNIQQWVKVIGLNLIKVPGIKGVSNCIYNYQHNAWRRKHCHGDKPIGNIEWIVGNLCSIPEYPDNHFDAVVSLSALEHIPVDILQNAIKEINRVLKADASWAITTSGTEASSTWYHQPSEGNCFSERDLEGLFDARISGELDAATAIVKYKNCNYLRNHLSRFYKKSGENGMPWGVWDPKYIPVGITNR